MWFSQRRPVLFSATAVAEKPHCGTYDFVKKERSVNEDDDHGLARRQSWRLPPRSVCYTAAHKVYLLLRHGRCRYRNPNRRS
jgi:hypothetical protein